MEEQKTSWARERTRLANERTFLAYVRTAISLLILGAAAIHFFGNDSVTVAFGIFSLALGFLILAVGFVRFWRKREQIISV